MAPLESRSGPMAPLQSEALKSAIVQNGKAREGLRNFAPSRNSSGMSATASTSRSASANGDRRVTGQISLASFAPQALRIAGKPLEKASDYSARRMPVADAQLEGVEAPEGRLDSLKPPMTISVARMQRFTQKVCELGGRRQRRHPDPELPIDPD